MIHQQIAIEQLGEITAYNQFEHPIRLAYLWSEHIAVLVFVSGILAEFFVVSRLLN